MVWYPLNSAKFSDEHHTPLNVGTTGNPTGYNQYTKGLDHDLSHTRPRSRTADVRMLLASDAEGSVPLPEAAGMADTMSLAYPYAVCSHTDDAVGYVMP